MDSQVLDLDPDYLPQRHPDPYRKLALMVILRAVRDFAGQDLDDLAQLAKTESPRQRLKRQITGGRFLMEQTDAIWRHWWRLAGFGPTDPRPQRFYLGDGTVIDGPTQLAALWDQGAKLGLTKWLTRACRVT